MRHLFILWLVVFAGWVPGAAARAQGPVEPLYDPNQLPAFQGRLQLFTFTPRGDIDGFVLADGIEVKTPPHLTAALSAAVKPGDRVTVHGLKAASLPLIQALSVGNDSTGAIVVDTGPQPGRMASMLPAKETPIVSVAGRVRMLLHGPRGDVNGALLDDGLVLDLPPPEAERYAALLAPGRTIAGQGRRHDLPAGSFVELTALGPQGGALQPVTGPPRPPADPAERPPG